MTPEQELRLACLRIAVHLGGCPDCAVDLAADLAAFVLDGVAPGDDDDGDTGLRH